MKSVFVTEIQDSKFRIENGVCNICHSLKNSDTLSFIPRNYLNYVLRMLCIISNSTKFPLAYLKLIMKLFHQSRLSLWLFVRPCFYFCKIYTRFTYIW